MMAVGICSTALRRTIKGNLTLDYSIKIMQHEYVSIGMQGISCM